MATYEEIKKTHDLSKLKITPQFKPPQCTLYKKLMDKEL